MVFELIEAKVEKTNEDHVEVRHFFEKKNTRKSSVTAHLQENRKLFRR